MPVTFAYLEGSDLIGPGWRLVISSFKSSPGDSEVSQIVKHGPESSFGQLCSLRPFGWQRLESQTQTWLLASDPWLLTKMLTAGLAVLGDR